MSAPAPSSKWFGALRASLPRWRGKRWQGEVLAKTCAALNARVLLLNRPSEREKHGLSADNGAVVHIHCDLQDISSVPGAATQLHDLSVHVAPAGSTC